MTAAPTTQGAETADKDRAGVLSYPITTAYKRRSGLYVAAIRGEDPRYGVARDFAKGKAVKSRGVIEYGAGDLGDLPAWVVRRPAEPCGHCGQPRPVRDTGEDLIAAFASGWILHGRIFGTDDLLEVYAAGPPGSDGAWAGDWCDDCDVAPVFGAGVCSSCEEAQEAREHLASLPDTEVF